MTTTVYFDLDGTVLEYTTPFADLFTQTIPTDPSEEMIERYSEQVLSGLAEVEEEPYRRAFDTVRREYTLDIDPEALAAEYIEKEATATSVPAKVKRLVETIGCRHKTGILTNGDGRMQRQKIEQHGLDDCVDTVLISNEFGARKPSLEIFHEAKDRLPADTFVYIGNTFEQDIVPARETGFQTVYVGDEHRADAVVATNGTEELAAVLLPLIRGFDSVEYFSD